MRVLLVILIMGLNILSFGNDLEGRLVMPTDMESRSMFIRNMSIVNVDRLVADFVYMQGIKTSSVLGDPGTGNRDKFDYKISERSQGVGFLLPIGGASFGGDMSLLSKDFKTEVERRSFSMEETYRERYWRMHFIVDLTTETKAGFTYRYAKIENDILGDPFLDTDDRTDYLGELSGFMLSFYSKFQAFGLGGYYMPPLRGKSEIEGEQKILTTNGVTGMSVSYNDIKRWTLGVEIMRWFYKNDDRDDLSTSPIDQRSISLNGLDIDQRLLKTERISIGADYLVNSKLKLRCSLYDQDAVWLFNGEFVPGDRPSDETPMTYKGLKLAVESSNKGFYVKMGVNRSWRSLDRFVDTSDGERWFGHREYGQYSATEDSMFFGLGFLN